MTESVEQIDIKTHLLEQIGGVSSFYEIGFYRKARAYRLEYIRRHENTSRQSQERNDTKTIQMRSKKIDLKMTDIACYAIYGRCMRSEALKKTFHGSNEMRNASRPSRGANKNRYNKP